MEMSSLMLGLGVLTTGLAYGYLNWQVAAFVGYFSIMQGIHVVGYAVINDCSNPWNQIASYANYLHVCFQPLVTGIGILGLMKYSGFDDKRSVERMMVVLFISAVAGVMLSARIVSGGMGPLSDVPGSCLWCGPPCSFQGEKHINFSLPLRVPNYVTPDLSLHFFLMFIPFLFVNGFTAAVSVVLFLTTAVPAYVHNIESTEAGTIWCFTSILQTITVILLAVFARGDVSRGGVLKRILGK